MKTHPRLATALVIGTIVAYYFSGPPATEVKMFCSHDRVFIEFTEGGKTWGTMWLEDDGSPASCNVKVKTSTKVEI